MPSLSLERVPNSAEQVAPPQDGSTLFKLNWIDCLFLCSLLCCIAAGLYSLRLEVPDDGYIYLKIAQTIAQGGGWGFNFGHPVNAATSPAEALLLAGLLKLHLPGTPTPLFVSSWIGLFCLGSTLYIGLRQRSRAFAMLVASSASLLPATLVTIGMESAIFLACIAATALAVETESPIAFGVFAGLTALGRPEGILIVPIALGVQLLSGRRMLWSSMIPLLLIVGSWVGFSLYDFHTLLPHTLKVKVLQSNVSWWSSSWFTYFYHQLVLHKVLLIGLLGLGRLIYIFRKNRFLAIIVFFGLAQVIGYSLMKAPVGYFWYYAPGNLAYLVCMWVGFTYFLDLLAIRLPAMREPLWRNAITYTALAYVLVSYTRQIQALPRLYPKFQAYENLGVWVHDHSSPGDWVACDEVGYIGVYSQRSVLDMLGLLDARSVQPLAAHRWEWWLTDVPAPRFIAVHNPRWIGEPDQQRFTWPESATHTFHANYHSVYRADGLEVFEHVPHDLDHAAAAND